jgi:hypothetical protein
MLGKNEVSIRQLPTKITLGHEKESSVSSEVPFAFSLETLQECKTEQNWLRLRARAGHGPDLPGWCMCAEETQGPADLQKQRTPASLEPEQGHSSDQPSQLPTRAPEPWQRPSDSRGWYFLELLWLGSSWGTWVASGSLGCQVGHPMPHVCTLGHPLNTLWT